MAKNGLDATNYRGWISPDICIDEFTNELISEFVLGTPAYDLSKKSHGLYDYYGYKEMDDYRLLKSDLLQKVSLEVATTYEQLKDRILASNSINFTNTIPDNLSEIIYMYTDDASDNKFFKNYFYVQSTSRGKSKLTIQSEKICKENVVIVERLFFHLRNGLAHGCFSIVTKDNETYYIIQDESGNQISARMILKKSTLQAWIDYFHKRRAQITNTQEEEVA